MHRGALQLTFWRPRGLPLLNGSGFLSPDGWDRLWRRRRVLHPNGEHREALHMLANCGIVQGHLLAKPSGVHIDVRILLQAVHRGYRLQHQA